MKLCFWELNLAAVDVDGEGQRWGDPVGIQRRCNKDLHPRRWATGREKMHECKRHFRDKISGILEIS